MMEVSLTQMPLLNQRLTIWGEIVKAQSEGHELPALREKWPQNGSTVATALMYIRDVFTDVSGLGKRYGLKLTGESSSTTVAIMSRERSTKSSIPVTLSSAAGRRDIRDEEDMVGDKR
jgi:hypothetical protein